MKKIIVTICSIALFSLVIVGINFGSSKALAAEVKLVTKKGDQFVMITRGLDNDWSNDMNTGAKAAAEALGFHYESFGTEHKPGPMISMVEDKSIQGVKMFLLQPPDPSPVAKVCETTKENNGHFVVMWESPDWYHPMDCGDNYVSYTAGPGSSLYP